MNASLDHPNTVIHRSDNVDANKFNNFIYTRVYAAADTTVSINGSDVTLAKGVVLPITVKNIGSDTNVYLLGTNKQTGAGVIK